MGSLTPDKLTGFLGLGVAAFGLLKFLFALFNEVAWAAFVGLVLLVVIGYGAWQKVQASGGFQMGGAGGGSMGGGMPPSGQLTAAELTAAQHAAAELTAAQHAAAERTARRSAAVLRHVVRGRERCSRWRARIRARLLLSG